MKQVLVLAGILLLLVKTDIVASKAFSPTTTTTTTTTSSSAVLVSTGLRNLGNTCYLNAQLQCAFHIPLVRDMVLTNGLCNTHRDDDDDESSLLTTRGDDVKTFPNKEEDCDSTITTLTNSDEQENVDFASKPPVKKQSPGLLALKQVFGDMIQASTQQTGPISPRVLALSLGIPIMEQQDSQEFWKLLLPALQVPALTKLYQGQFEDYIVALDGSQRERRRQEAFLDLSLDVAIDGKDKSVMSSLQNMFGKPELLSVAEGNGWRPEKGADKVDAHKGSLIRTQGLPSILQLHLKRFSYDWNRDQMEKVNSPLSFPPELDLSTIIHSTGNATLDQTRCRYDLQSVVVHVGEFHVGHYYAYVRPDVNDNKWYRLNDDSVKPVSFADVVADATGGKVAATGVESESPKKRNWLQYIKQSFQRGSSYGFGGSTSNAYVLQYVQRCSIPALYKKPEERKGG